MLGVVSPGGGFVVAGSGFQAAVQDAGQAVAELAQRGVVPGAAGPECVVVGPGARGDGQRAEGLLVQRIGQAAVAYPAGQQVLRLPDLRVIGLLPA